MARLAQELRDAVLQAAIEGKLTDHNPQEHCPEILHVEQKESIEGRRVKNKKIANLDLSERPFEIPDNWRWVRLGQACTVARGGSPRPIKEFITEDEDGVNWIKIGDTEKGGKYITSVKEKIKPSGIAKSRLVKSGDFLLTNSMSFGRPYILKVDGCIHDGWLVISQETTIFDTDYLYWLLSSKYAYHQFSGQVSGAVVKNLNSDKVANSVFPLPPIEEQQRIVDRVNEIMAKIDEFEVIENELEALKAAFPGEMKEALLQAAMEGKLTYQDADDRSVKVLCEEMRFAREEGIKNKEVKKEKLDPIEDVLFDIPLNWSWIRLGAIANLRMGKTPPRAEPKWWGTDYQWVSIADMIKDGIITDTKESISKAGFEEKFKSRMSPKGTLLMSFKLTIGKMSLLGIDAVHNEAIVSIFPYSRSDAVVRNYLFKVLPYLSKYGDTKGAIKGNTLNAKSLNNILVPLPPIEEQQRIVDRLDALLPLCDDLEELS